MKEAQKEFNRVFDMAKERREEFLDKYQDNSRKEFEIELKNLCELYFSAGQRNNF